MNIGRKNGGDEPGVTSGLEALKVPSERSWKFRRPKGDASFDKPRRSWAKRFLIALCALVALALVAGVGSFGYAQWRFGQVSKIDLGGVLRDDNGSGDPMNVLLVGSDSRADISPEETKEFGTQADVGPTHSDTIMIMHVDPKAQRASILSLPRDLWVNIYSPDGKDLGKEKINAAIQGGQQQLIKTISMNFNIPIDHYMQVDFNGFRDIVSSVGGVPVRFDAPARDKFSGLNVPAAGCKVLSGDEALSYVRSRHYESYESGRWRTDPRSDLGRIDRQQDFIRRVLRVAISKGARNPITLNNLVSAGVKNVQLDDGFSLGDITRLARRFQSLDPSQVEMSTLPNTSSSVRSGGINLSVQLVKQPDAAQTIDRFLNGPPKATASNPTPTVLPSSISVRVLNGSGVSGQATDTSTSLREAGFVVSGAGDAKSFGSATTSIRYAKGQKDKGDSLAKFVKGKVAVTEDLTLKGVDTVITTGSSFTGIADPSAVAQTTTSTTAAPSKPEPSAAPDQSGC